MIVFLIYRKNFVGTQKRVRISHGERAIGVRAYEIRLYISMENCWMQILFIKTVHYSD